MNYRLVAMHKILGLAFIGLGVIAALCVALYLPPRYYDYSIRLYIAAVLGLPLALDVGYRLARRRPCSLLQRMLSPEMGAHYFLLPLWLLIVGCATVYFVIRNLPI